MAPRSLTVVPASGGASRLYLMDGAWINELVWARDGKSLFTLANDGTFAKGEHMFDQAIVRVSPDSGKADTELSRDDW